jgi:hypothetical protein
MWRFSHVFCALSVLATCGPGALAQAPAADESKTATIVMARWGERAESDGINAYHFTEVFQVRRKWIYPDIGYVDFGHNNYREFFVGGGDTFYKDAHLTAIGELFYEQGLGPAAHDARWLVPWTELQYRIKPRLGGEIVYFAYAPLNSTAKVEHIFDRGKLEYKISSHWKIGAGYSGKIIENTSWQNKPFLTTTLSTKAGDLEFWVQRLPQNAVQIQVRYKLIHLQE